MKNLLLALVLAVPLSAQFKLNTNPENPNRMPDWKTEIGIVLEHDSPTITIGGKNGKSTNYLSAGVLVMVDEQTKKAKWVAVCGNTVYTDWTPKGKIISFQQAYEKECQGMMGLVLDRITNIETKVEILVNRKTLTKEDLERGFSEFLAKQQENKPLNLPPSWWMENRKWVIPVAIATVIVVFIASHHSSEIGRASCRERV
jgi:hypothetical protein